MRSPIASAAILLGFYITMYLAVAAALRFIDPAGADDVASDSRAAPLASAPVTPAADFDEPVRDAYAPRRGDRAPDCRPGAKADLRCAAD